MPASCAAAAAGPHMGFGTNAAGYVDTFIRNIRLGEGERALRRGGGARDQQSGCGERQGVERPRRFHAPRRAPRGALRPRRKSSAERFGRTRKKSKTGLAPCRPPSQSLSIASSATRWASRRPPPYVPMVSTQNFRSAESTTGRREDGRPSRSDVWICVERRMTAVSPAPGRAS